MKRRKKMRLQLPVLLLIAILLSGMTQMKAYAAQGDEIRAAKKVISLVYDDSGSMLGDPWGYANYATQGLFALLNEQDELYITYLSDPSHSKQVGLSDLKSAVSDMHNWNESGGTPAEAIYTARDTLERIQNEDPAVEYWLIVMTDGGFYDFQSGDDLQSLLSGSAGKEMPNHSTLRVAYFGMGSEAETVTEDKNKGLFSWKSADGKAIISGVNDMAGTVSGRIPADDVVQKDDHTITFKSELPLYSISVLSQDSGAVVKEAKTAEEDLNVVRNIGLDANTANSPDLKLKGNAAVINKTDGSGNAAVIPKGSYSIVFSEPVDVGNLVIQYEPAIALLAELKREGILLDVHSDTIANGDSLDVSFVPVVPGTDEEISGSDLPSGIKWTISHRVDGNEIDSVNDRVMTGIKAEPGHNEIICTMHIPGFSDVVSRLEFDVEEGVVITSLGIETEQPEDLSYPRSELGKSGLDPADNVRFIITNDGVPLSKEDLEKAGIELVISSVTADESELGKIVRLFGIKEGKAELVQNDDGSYELIPKQAFGFPFTRPFTKAGSYVVTVEASTDSSVVSQGNYKVVPGLAEWPDLLILLLLLVLLLYILHTVFIREKFPKCTIQYARISQNGEHAYLKKSAPQSLGLAQSLWPPFRKQSTCKVKANTKLILVAEDGGVSVKGKSISNAGFNCYGAYRGDIPTSSAESDVDYEGVLDGLVKSQTDKKGRAQIDNQSLPARGSILVFCREDKNGTRKGASGISIR